MSTGHANGHANGNGRKEYTRVLVAILAAAWGVLVLAGAGWIGSIQSQVNTNAINTASLAVALAKLEVRSELLARDGADLRIKVNEMERRANGGR